MLIFCYMPTCLWQDITWQLFRCFYANMPMGCVYVNSYMIMFLHMYWYVSCRFLYTNMIMMKVTWQYADTHMNAHVNWLFIVVTICSCYYLYFINVYLVLRLQTSYLGRYQHAYNNYCFNLGIVTMVNRLWCRVLWCGSC